MTDDTRALAVVVAWSCVAWRDEARPEVARLDIARPEVARLDIARPEVARPEVARPEVARLEVARSDETPVAEPTLPARTCELPISACATAGSSWPFNCEDGEADEREVEAPARPGTSRWPVTAKPGRPASGRARHGSRPAAAYEQGADDHSQDCEAASETQHDEKSPRLRPAGAVEPAPAMT